MAIQDFFVGITAYAEANKLIFRNRLWPVLAVPGFFSFVFIACVMYAGIVYADDLSIYLLNAYLPEFIKNSFAFYSISVMIWILIVIFLFFSYQQISLILFSPILSFLSEKTEILVTGHPAVDFNLGFLIKDLIRSIVINIRYLVCLLFFMSIAGMCFFIPLIGFFLGPFLLFAVQAYYGGCGLIDYTLERHRVPVGESVRFSGENKGFVLGIGTGMLLILMVPVVGWILAPGYGTVASTLAILGRRPRKS